MLPPAPPPAPAPPPTPLPALALATQRSFFDALRAHDPKALAALYAPDADVDLGVGVRQAHGPDAIAAVAESLFAAFPDAKVQWGTLLQSGDRTAVELAWTGTHTAALGGLAPTKKVVGAHGLLVERFAASGLLASQHLYFDADTLAADLATRGGKPHPFDGLPTAQTTVADPTAASADDDAAIHRLAASFGQGAYADARALADGTTTWTDATRGHGTTGKGAVLAWTSSLEHMWKRAERPLLDAWSAGDWLVLEWGVRAGAAVSDAAVPHVAEVVRFDGGHLAEVRTYRSSARSALPEPGRHVSGGKNQ